MLLVEGEHDPSLDPLLILLGDCRTDEVAVDRPLDVTHRGLTGEFVRLDDVLCNLVDLVDVHTPIIQESCMKSTFDL